MDADTEMTPADVDAPANTTDSSTGATLMSDIAPASAAAAAASAGAHAAAGGSTAATAAPAPAGGAPTLTPLQRLEGQLSQSLQHLWTSALIVEHGVAPTPQQPAIGDESLERLMGMAQPKMTMQDITNQNLQRQIDGYLESLLAIDGLSRKIPLSVPKSVIECVEQGHNPSLVSEQVIKREKHRSEEVRAKVFATKVLHDQLKMRVDIWDQMLQQEASTGNQAAYAILHANFDTLKTTHEAPRP